MENTIAKAPIPLSPPPTGHSARSAVVKDDHRKDEAHHGNGQTKWSQLNFDAGIRNTKGQSQHALKKDGGQLRTEQQHKKTITVGVKNRANRCPKPLKPIIIVSTAEITMPTDRLVAISLSGVPRDASASGNRQNGSPP